MNGHSDLSDLPSETFAVLSELFFDRGGNPCRFPLRDKRNTQDDPFDEYVHHELERRLPGDAICVKAPGPLITPDMVVLRRAEVARHDDDALRDNPGRVFALEVKKLERTQSGRIARRTGLDYNTTPPCGTVSLYRSSGQRLDVKSFYLFVALGAAPDGDNFLSALALCDGDILNSDFDLYRSVVGEREKVIGLGTFEDGVDRQRPMLIFSNPLSCSELDHQATLVHTVDGLDEVDERLTKVGELIRVDGQKREWTFYCYRTERSIDAEDAYFKIREPFATPNSRSSTTQSRGRFVLDV